MIDQGTLERLLAPTRDRGVTVRFGCGEVVGTSGSALVVAAKSGGTVYAENYAYAEQGDVVCYIASGPNVVAFASKDQARLAHEMEQSGIGVLDAWPVGSVFVAKGSAKNPAALLGGTWTLITTTHLFIGLWLYYRVA